MKYNSFYAQLDGNQTQPLGTTEEDVNARRLRHGASQIWRLAAVSAPAAVMTLGLFSLMDALITVDDITLSDASNRILAPITPAPLDPDAMTVRPKPQPIEVAKTPPPVPTYNVGPTDINLPVPQVPGAAPDQFSVSPIRINIGPVTTMDTTARPISPPNIRYPISAIKRGLSGSCEVRLDVSITGQPMNVRAACSDKVFEREAIRAVKATEFAPKIIRGQRAEMRGVIFPLEFQMEE